MVIKKLLYLVTFKKSKSNVTLLVLSSWEWESSGGSGLLGTRTENWHTYSQPLDDNEFGNCFDYIDTKSLHKSDFNVL